MRNDGRLGLLMIPNGESDQRKLLAKAWDVNTYLAGDRDRYRHFYHQVRTILRQGELDAQAKVVGISNLELDHNDTIDPDAPEARRL